MVRILICDSIHEDGVKMLKGAGFQVDLDTSITPEELIEKIPGYDAIVIRSRTKVRKDVLEAATNLKAVARAGVGLDNVDLAAAKELGVKVINSPEAPSNAVAELIIGLMFSLARNIAEADGSMKQGNWEKKRLTGFELRGKTMGIIGLGRIGELVAEKAKALGMKLLIYNRTRDRVRSMVEAMGAELVDIERVYKDSDIISIHLPATPETRHMIGSDQFEMMKPTAYIINAARGGLIDEAALKIALDEGKIAGAALDVYEEEPTRDMPLIGRANVVCTPHIGAGSVEASIGNSTIVAAKLIEFLG
ncbi:hydroxyacid dehydrogenase [Candidatus Bathyarchaeota archaeon]|nr:hydroxyacid dehydrogenase [Candidatus Bathyarchaeota archaeon]